MKALTLRNLSPDLVRAIERKARELGSSLNKAVLALLQEARGGAGKTLVTHHDLDHLCGRWSPAQADSFEAALRAQRGLDPELWRR